MKRIQFYILLIVFGTIFSCIKFKELASLTTNNASDITTNSVTSGGNITNGGGADITARGVCWSTSQSPAVSGSHTNDGAGTGSYTSNITGLTPGTMYYIRAYATNNAGTAYGNEISCTTIALSAPTLTTVTATEVGLTSAKSGGTISSDGGAPITGKGVCWSTSAHPTIEGSKTSDGTGSTAFVSNLTPLTPGTTYYYRAYATNSVGTAYGNELTFTTTCTTATATTNTATGVSTTSATLNGTINGNGSSTTVTFEYGTTSGYGSTASATPGTVSGSSNTTVSSGLTGLTINTPYHYRVKAVNCGGTIYGSDQTFTTTCTAATATTNTATGISSTSATLNGTINGNGSSTTVTFEYGTTTGYGSTASATPGTVAGSSNTSVSSGLTGLTINTPYHYRVKAVNCGGTIYGSDQIFTTACTAATATTNTATGISSTSATLNGTINGNGSSTTVTFEYGTTTSYGSTASATPGTVSGSSNTSVSAGLTGLTINTPYHYRVKAVNCGGTIYGSDQMFTTTCTAATATTNTATGIDATSATLNGTINGNGSSTTVTFEYGTTTSYGSTISAIPGTISGSSNTTVSAGITGLTINTPYHYRVKAVNCGGTIYGSDQIFTTTCTAATATTNIATGIGATSATLNGTINGNGSSTTVTFEYGTSTGYGSTISATPGTISGSSNTTVSAGITGLTINTLYHYRVKAVNCGATTYGSDQTLTTTCTAATVTTNTATSITTTSATLNGTINGNGSSTTVTFEYGTNTGYGNTISATPGIVTGNSNVPVTVSITGLTLNTEFHFRVKAVTCQGTTYGNDQFFTTTQVITDADGNIYNYIQIGTQFWIAENLKTTKYNNSELIGTTTPYNKDIVSETSPKYQWAYLGNEGNVSTYGRLYTWYAITDSRNICPTGWHIPSDSEWDVLVNYLLGTAVAGRKLKEAGSTHWQLPIDATNETGFTALPGGFRLTGGGFGGVGTDGLWWSSTPGSSDINAWIIGMGNNYPDVYQQENSKRTGYSVRCIKD